MATYVVIFGAAVREDGSPSGTLLRRCESAIAIGRKIANPVFLATGGVGRHGPAEAALMRALLVERGIPPERILVEDQARDTLESVRNCSRLLRGRSDVERIVVCSSGYHNPRCILLFRLAGLRSSAEPTPTDREHIGWARWIWYVLKETVATPYDATIMLCLKLGNSV